MMHKGVLLDTSFFIRLLDKTEKLHLSAKGYFKYFLEHDIEMMISTISIAEYCVRGDVHELPLKNVQIIPFNLDHAKKAGEFAKIAFEAKKKTDLDVTSRNIIPNDTKLFAQADCEKMVEYYLTADIDCLKIYNLLKKANPPKFQLIDLNTPYNETFGLLKL